MTDEVESVDSLTIKLLLLSVFYLTTSFIAAKSIQGDWELVANPEISQATPDEISDSDRVYYTFSKPSKFGDGTYKTYYAGGVEEGTYKLSEKDGKEFINMGTEDLKYKITGSYTPVIPTQPPTEAPTQPPTNPPTEKPTEPAKLLGDVDNDGQVTIMDATLIQMLIAQLISEL